MATNDDALVVCAQGTDGSTTWSFSADVDRRASMGFAVRHAAGQGFGAFAMKAFALVDVLMVDPPLISWPVGVSMTRSNVALRVEALIGEMPAAAAAQLSSLSHNPRKHGDSRSSMGVWQSNCLPSHDDGGASLYADASMLNHSCAPNCEQGYVSSTRAACLRVTGRDVRCDDQLSIAYISEPGTRDERRARLRERFGFTCECVLCSLKGAELELSDSRQSRMSVLRGYLLGTSPSPYKEGGTSSPSQPPPSARDDPSSILAAVDEMLSLQQREGLPCTWGQEYQIMGMRTSQQQGNPRAASAYAWGAAEATRVGAGTELPIYGQLVERSKALIKQAMASDGAIPAAERAADDERDSRRHVVEKAEELATHTPSDPLASYMATLRRSEALLAGYVCSTEQQHYNATLRAPNVWEVAVPAEVLDEATALFQRCNLAQAFFALRDGGARHAAVVVGDARFFALQTGKDVGSSDITYISADDEVTYDKFEALFHGIGLEEQFAPIAQPAGRLRMYSAKYVVRSRCACPCFHSDWPTELGAQAITLMTPLADYKARGSFSLLYGQGAPLRGSDEERHAQAEAEAGDGELRPSGVGTDESEARYEYKKGTAVCFGASFCHSTEPGAAHEDDRAHAYLCFTFGTDDPERWPLISSTIANYTRVCRDTEGKLGLTRLGRDLLESGP